MFGQKERRDDNYDGDHCGDDEDDVVVNWVKYEKRGERIKVGAREAKGIGVERVVEGGRVEVGG